MPYPIRKFTVLLCCLNFTASLLAQSIGKDPLPSDVAVTANITTAAMNQTLIASEQEYVQKVLSAGGVEAQDVAIHTTYNTLLNSIQNEWSSDLERQDLAIKDFENTLAAAESDHSVKYQFLVSLRQHFNGLKENIAIIGRPKSGN